MRAIEIANLFIRYHGNDLYLTNLKLNKLVYYAQVESLRTRGYVLFSDPIQAWQYGPVEEEVYHAFSIYGRGRITSMALVSNLQEHAVSETVKAKKIVDCTAKEYGGLSAYDLVTFSHRRGSAWDKVFTANEHALITEDVILRSKDGLDKPDFKRTVAYGVEETERIYPNALRMLKDS